MEGMPVVPDESEVGSVLQRLLCRPASVAAGLPGHGLAGMIVVLLVCVGRTFWRALLDWLAPTASALCPPGAACARPGSAMVPCVRRAGRPRRRLQLDSRRAGPVQAAGTPLAAGPLLWRHRRPVPCCMLACHSRRGASVGEVVGSQARLWPPGRCSGATADRSFAARWRAAAGGASGRSGLAGSQDAGVSGCRVRVGLSGAGGRRGPAASVGCASRGGILLPQAPVCGLLPAGAPLPRTLCGALQGSGKACFPGCGSGWRRAPPWCAGAEARQLRSLVTGALPGLQGGQCQSGRSQAVKEDAQALGAHMQARQVHTKRLGGRSCRRGALLPTHAVKRAGARAGVEHRPEAGAGAQVQGRAGGGTSQRRTARNAGQERQASLAQAPKEGAHALGALGVQVGVQARQVCSWPLASPLQAALLSPCVDTEQQANAGAQVRRCISLGPCCERCQGCELALDWEASPTQLSRRMQRRLQLEAQTLTGLPHWCHRGQG